MSKASFVLFALAITSSTALAQPGETPPTEPVPPPPGQPPGETGVVVDAQVQASTPIDIDAILAKVEAEAPTIETVARGTFNRARRAISIGPTVGLWTGAFTAYSEFETALTVGVGVEMFKVPVLPEPATIKALVIERVKAKLKDQLIARFTGRQPDPLEVEATAKQIYEEVRQEFLGLANTRAKTLERPRFGGGIEVNRLFQSKHWVTRARVGVGVWKFTVGLSVAGACLGGPCGDNLELYSGPEIILHALASKNPRASVVDAFVRFDLQVTGRSDVDPYDQVVIGARFLLDLI